MPLDRFTAGSSAIVVIAIELLTNEPVLEGVPPPNLFRDFTVQLSQNVYVLTGDTAAEAIRPRFESSWTCGVEIAHAETGTVTPP